MPKRLLPLLPLILLIACVPNLSDPQLQREVLQTLTATAWTPTPTATPEPNTSGVVEVLNSAMFDSDPLEETIDARFSVLDSHVLLDKSMQRSQTLQIDVDCEWIFSDSCTPEGSFVALMRAFRANSRVFKDICDDIPSTIRILQVVTFDRMARRGTLGAAWQDVTAYVTGQINGTQFGSRIGQIASAP
jgi:hypothetical protein